MKLSQKRTCAGCKAYPYETVKTTCQLGYSCEPSKTVKFVVVAFRPLEPCYKPTTNNQFIELLEMVR